MAASKKVTKGMHLGGMSPMSKLTQEAVVTIRERAALGANFRVLADAYGVTQQAIGHAVRGQTWKHVPFPATFLPPMTKSRLDSRLYVTECGLVFNESGKRLHCGALVGGYRKVEIMNRGVTSRYYVHRLVAYEYCDGYAHGLVVNHKDGNPSNNHYTNLEWVTQKQNVRHAIASGTAKTGALHPMAKLADADVQEIRRLLAAGCRAGVIAKRFGVSRCTISNIKTGKRWSKLQPTVDAKVKND